MYVAGRGLSLACFGGGCGVIPPVGVLGSPLADKGGSLGGVPGFLENC